MSSPQRMTRESGDTHFNKPLEDFCCKEKQRDLERDEKSGEVLWVVLYGWQII